MCIRDRDRRKPLHIIPEHIRPYSKTRIRKMNIERERKRGTAISTHITGGKNAVGLCLNIKSNKIFDKNPPADKKFNKRWGRYSQEWRKEDEVIK